MSRLPAAADRRQEAVWSEGSGSGGCSVRTPVDSLTVPRLQATLGLADKIGPVWM